MWVSLLTCGVFYPEKVQQQSSQHLYIRLISHCPAEAELPHAKHTKYGPSHNIRLHPLLQEQHVHTLLRFYECSSNLWTGERHCNAEIYVAYFSHSGRHRNKWDAQENKLLCDLQGSPWTSNKPNHWRRLEHPRKINVHYKKENNFLLCWHNGCGVKGGEEVVNSCESCSIPQNSSAVFPFLETSS